MKMMIIAGNLYDVGPIEPAKSMVGSLYLDYRGLVVQICDSGSEFEGERHPLTPIPDDDERAVQWRLGGEELNRVIPSARERATGEKRFGVDGERCVDHKGNVFKLVSQSHVPVIILRPPPEPEKTLRQAFQEFVDASTNATWKDWADWSGKREAAQQYLADTE